MVRRGFLFQRNHNPGQRLSFPDRQEMIFPKPRFDFSSESRPFSSTKFNFKLNINSIIKTNNKNGCDTFRIAMSWRIDLASKFGWFRIHSTLYWIPGSNKEPVFVTTRRLFKSGLWKPWFFLKISKQWAATITWILEIKKPVHKWSFSFLNDITKGNSSHETMSP